MNDDGSTPEHGFSMDGGNIRGFVDQNVAMVRCVTSNGDPVEMNAHELRSLIEQLDGLLVAMTADDAPPAAPSANPAPVHDPLRELGDLIESWCQRRAFDLLATVLPAYRSPNGLTDGWGELRSAVRSAQLWTKDAVELERLRNVERVLDEMIGLS
jgi:hypothetical protein